MQPALLSLLNGMGLGDQENADSLFGLELPETDGSIPSGGYKSTSGLQAKMSASAPNLPSSAPLAKSRSVEFFTYNPGESALSYANKMNHGIPDALAVTAASMPWMAHYRSTAGGKLANQSKMPPMEHPALGAPPYYYKMFNQLGGAGAYNGTAGMGGSPPLPKSMDLSDKEMEVSQAIRSVPGFLARDDDVNAHILYGSGGRFGTSG